MCSEEDDGDKGRSSYVHATWGFHKLNRPGARCVHGFMGRERNKKTQLGKVEKRTRKRFLMQQGMDTRSELRKTWTKERTEEAKAVTVVEMTMQFGVNMPRGQHYWIPFHDSIPRSEAQFTARRLHGRSWKASVPHKLLLVGGRRHRLLTMKVQRRKIPSTFNGCGKANHPLERPHLCCRIKSHAQMLAHAMQCMALACTTYRTPLLDPRDELKQEWEKRFPSPHHFAPLLSLLFVNNPYEAMKRKIISSRQMASSIDDTFTTAVE
ncbi:hypothetical protein BHE74_00035885 [Ensete ventricosum]|nr:hypothetical protein GW17_00049334 [Ensete ventricosum]RWW57335.1 hypothetical protein BHE74_00035885 [Ensete ventricosum]